MAGRVANADPVEVSGVYPHLAMYNNHGECGTGAVVPWAGRLWAITYAPHEPFGSTDKLYSITPDLQQTIHPESIGGTPANRMIHRPSGQLFIGPYAIDETGKVRAISSDKMPGRHTASAQHLTDPAGKIYYATMEEGFYEVDVESLSVKTLFTDIHVANGKRYGYAPHGGRLLPGHHGKGAYSGQGRLIYSNNGEKSAAAQRRPDITSGVLAEWDGESDAWTIVRRNQFTEVTGPGGIYGSDNPAEDPIWAVGWDHKSVLLGVRTKDLGWSFYRLPKGSHSYDGAHGWNTEWPRIRDIGEDKLLMTMHGLFWSFPRAFSPAASVDLSPRSAYLKVVGDFCRWGDRVVFGCDDTAATEFLNTRRAKGRIAGPGQSHSNLWFVDPEKIDRLGPALGRGGVWIDEAVASGQRSDPFLFAGFDHRGLHLAHNTLEPVTLSLEVDRKGNGQWTLLKTLTVDANGYHYEAFNEEERGAWVRVVPEQNCEGLTAFFHYANKGRRTPANAPIFDSVADMQTEDRSIGLLWVLDGGRKRLGFASEDGYYELDERLSLEPVADPKAAEQTASAAPLASDVLSVDAASVVYTDDRGDRWRLPKGHRDFDDAARLHEGRIDREVVTERDLMNCHGTFYELPARNAGGFSKIRPIATHNKRISDYCSYRGLMVVSGIAKDAPASEHVVRSTDGQAALWVGTIDDLWQLGKPRGEGGPWHDTQVAAGKPSDPYLMMGYDKKSFTVSHDGVEPVTVTLEVDITGEGSWQPWASLTVAPDSKSRGQFPDGFQAYWVRAVADRDCVASVQFRYE